MARPARPPRQTSGMRPNGFTGATLPPRRLSAISFLVIPLIHEADTSSGAVPPGDSGLQHLPEPPNTRIRLAVLVPLHAFGNARQLNRCFHDPHRQHLRALAGPPPRPFRKHANSNN